MRKNTMKENYCHIIAILDRSGSMSSLQDEVIGSFNNFLKDQKKAAGEATITLIQFDDQYEVNYAFRDVSNATDLNRESYSPRGMTAMYDAIGRSISSAGAVLSKMDEHERPSKVVVLIQTDGFENASREYSSVAIKRMITEQTDKYSWEFVFLGANIDAKETAVGIGIKKENAMSYGFNAQDTVSAINSVSENLTNFRSCVKSSMGYTKADYAKQESVKND
jgi:uncharacterized protein YegL